VDKLETAIPLEEMYELPDAAVVVLINVDAYISVEATEAPALTVYVPVPPVPVPVRVRVPNEVDVPLEM
jgi:hypothetical protein